MADRDPQLSQQSSPDALQIARSIIFGLDQYVQKVSIDVITNGVPYPVSTGIAQQMGARGVAALDSAYRELTDTMSREDLLELTRQAIDERSDEGLDEASEEVEKRVLFKEGFLLSMLSRDERAQVLGRTAA